MQTLQHVDNSLLPVFFCKKGLILFHMPQIKVANFKITFKKILYYFIYYNYIFEFVLGEGSDVHIMVQNVFMYLDSIVCNLILLGLKVVFIKQYSPLSWCLQFLLYIALSDVCIMQFL